MIEPFETEKQCSKCLACKPLHGFGSAPGSRDGYDTVCRACRSKRDRERYQARKEQGIKRSRDPAAKQDDSMWPVPTHTLSDGLSCVRMRKWRGPVRSGPLRASL